ncbi:hypothetical protein [Ammoniphilus sp. YIM 78166]|uniref:hypothetical protein n=1 Tax=Ammoniphilus sp. YIM 78166 TaxID=1644106 RepID=UPI00106F3358|nr:hypothetical protein [Ammoniphilus sp. YIM 78166]
MVRKLFSFFFILFPILTGCGTYEEPIQPTRYHIENRDRNAGDNEDPHFPVDPSIQHDDESIVIRK